MSSGAHHRRIFVRPPWFQAPPEPSFSPSISYGHDTSSARFALNVAFAAKRYSIPAAALRILSQIAGALVSVICAQAIDSALATSHLGQLLLWIAVLVLDFLLLSLAGRFGTRIGLYGMLSVTHALRTMVSERLLHPKGLRARTHDGAMLSVANNDVVLLGRAVELSYVAVGDLAALVFCIGALFTISWPLGFAALAAAPVLLWAMHLAGEPLLRRSRAQQAKVAEATGQAADLVSGFRVLRGLGAEAVAADRYTTVSTAALAETLRARAARGTYFGSMNVLSGVFVAALATFATALALDRHLSIGALIAALGLIQYTVFPLTSLPGTAGARWAVARASAGRVLEVLRSPHAIDGPVLESEQRGAKHARSIIDVTLPDGTRLHAGPGDLLGIRCNAHTAQALFELLATGRGEGANVAIDGVPAQSMPIDEYRGHVLCSPHAAHLFDGTIVENLEVPGGNPDLVQAALHASVADEILSGLDGGIASPVGEGGNRVSGGQRQRIALARSLFADPSILVLHDPTTAVDAVTEALIAERLAGARADRATILLTGSAALLGVCQRVVDVEEQ